MFSLVSLSIHQNIIVGAVRSDEVPQQDSYNAMPVAQPQLQLSQEVEDEVEPQQDSGSPMLQHHNFGEVDLRDETDYVNFQVNLRQ